MTKFPPKRERISGNNDKEEFIGLFSRGESRKRYVHISAHGDENGFLIHGGRETLVTIRDFKHYNKEYGGVLDGSMEGRFLTMSTCGCISDRFLKDIHKLFQFEAVISPMNEVYSDESAIFFINFYFNLSRINRTNTRVEKEIKLVDFIDTFQKTKIGYLLQGGLGGMRLLYNAGKPGKLTTII